MCVRFVIRPIHPARVAACLLALATMGVTGFAEGKEDLKATLVARKVTMVAGKESLTPAETAKPGEVIEYQATYRNQSAKALRNVQPTLPIPAGGQFVPDALKPAPTSASVDGSSFEPYPLKRTITLPDGKTQVVDVPLAEYRALRWTIDAIAPNTARSVAARVRILTDAPRTAAK